MAKTQTGGGKGSIKHVQIDKAQARVAITVALLVFVIVFSLIMARSLWELRGFQSRVIKEKEVAVAQLNDNLAAAQRLELSYQAFVDVQTNVIGGISEGSGERDGDNAKIILDALPSQYDFPALVTSVDKILTDNGYPIEDISGIDESADVVDVDTDDPLEMIFGFRARTSTASRALDLLNILERSIRPIYVSEMRIKFDTDIEVTVEATSFWQPEERLDISTKEVR